MSSSCMAAGRDRPVPGWAPPSRGDPGGEPLSGQHVHGPPRCHQTHAGTSAHRPAGWPLRGGGTGPWGSVAPCMGVTGQSPHFSLLPNTCVLQVRWGVGVCCLPSWQQPPGWVPGALAVDRLKGAITTYHLPWLPGGFCTWLAEQRPCGEDVLEVRRPGPRSRDEVSACLSLHVFAQEVGVGNRPLCSPGAQPPHAGAGCCNPMWALGPRLPSLRRSSRSRRKCCSPSPPKQGSGGSTSQPGLFLSVVSASASPGT